MSNKLILVVGHSTTDPGAVRGKLQEHELAKSLVQDVIKELDKYNVEFSVIPEGLSLKEKIKYINAQFDKDDKLLSFHLNAAVSGSASGYETYFENGYEESKKIANIIHENIIEVTDFRDRTVKKDSNTSHGRLGILRDTVCPGALLECGFIGNSKDIKYHLDETYRKILVEGIVKGISEIMGFKIESQEGNYYKLMKKEVPEDKRVFNNYVLDDPMNETKSLIEIGIYRKELKAKGNKFEK